MAFPPKPEDLFRFHGLIIGSVEANYFTPTQQQMIHDFVDRRGGGCCFMGGRCDAVRWRLSRVRRWPTWCPSRSAQYSKGTFHRDFTGEELTPEGAQSVICRLETTRRATWRWKKMPQMANYQEVGEPKPGATVLLESTPAGKRKMPLLVTENYGRGRTVVLRHRGKLALENVAWTTPTTPTPRSGSRLMRYLVTDTPGQVMRQHAQAACWPTKPRADPRGGARQGSTSPCTNAKVQARFLGAGWQLRQRGAGAGRRSKKACTRREWTAEKPGSYVAEIMAGRDQEEIGRDVLIFRREDGVAENFHTSQNRELLEKLADQTGGRYYSASNAASLANEISYSEAGITTRETRDFGICRSSFCWRCGCAAANGCCGGDGVWYDLRGRHPACGGLAGRPAALERFVARERGYEPAQATSLPTWLLVSLAAAVLARHHLLRHHLRPGRRAGLRAALQDVGRGYRQASKRRRAKVETLVNATREQVRARARSTSPATAKPHDALVLMLIGHGSYDGVEYKFNIPGPDITGTELAALLDRIPATRQLVVNMTSSSGGSIESLRRPNRVVITATKTGTEKNATVFARYWAEALRDPAADSDKNEVVSALEAFQLRAAEDDRVLRIAEAPGHRARRSGRHRQGRRRARSLAGERRRQAGRRLPGGAPGRQRRGRARSRQAPLLDNKEHSNSPSTS